MDSPGHKRLVSQIVRGASVIAFPGGIVGYLRCMLDGSFVMAGTLLAVCLMTIPFLNDGKGLWTDRLTASLEMLCGFFGLVVGVLAYFALFYFSWFSAIFGNKGMGPVGLILFASLFLFLGVYVGDRGLRVLGRWFRIRGRTPGR